MAYNKLKALNANIEAIEIAMRLKTQELKPTEADKETLSQYSGFGGIKEVLNIGTDKPMQDEMSGQLQNLQRIIEEYPGFADETMRNSVIEGIKASVLTAFYTPSFIVKAIAKEIHSLFRKHSLTMRSFLEPSAGTGGFLPVAMDGTATYAIEKDPVTGLVLSMLHDDTRQSADRICRTRRLMSLPQISLLAISVCSMRICGNVVAFMTRQPRRYTIISSSSQWNCLMRADCLYSLPQGAWQIHRAISSCVSILSVMQTLSPLCVFPITFS